MPIITETTDAAANSSTAYTLYIGQTAQGVLATGADRDWFAVSLTGGTTYSFAMVGTGVDNVGDPYLRLHGGNGNSILAQADDGLPNANSLLRYTPTVSGTYFLDAGSFQNGFAGQYGLSITQSEKLPFDTEMGAGIIDTNESWSAIAGTGATITYGFRLSAAPYSVPGSNISTFTQFTAAEIAAVESALQMFSEICGVAFQRVNPGGYTNNAAMLFGNYFDPNDGASAFAYYPGSTAANSRDGDVWINTESTSTTSLPQGSYDFATIMHEIGHALGLSHPGLYNAAPGLDHTYLQDAEFVQDSQQYSIMSYFAATEAGAGDYGSDADTPMLFDVLALQNIYGANLTTRAGDTVYGFGSTAGSTYDFTINSSPAFSLWDGGGIDLLDCSGFGQGQIIDLREGAFSYIGGMEKNVSIALGALIENATGGGGNDSITGNDAANILSGGVGNDGLYGGSGNDVLHGGVGSDGLYGGNDDDLLDASTSASGTADGDQGNDVVLLGASHRGILRGDIGVDTLVANGTNFSTASVTGFEFLETGATPTRGTAAQFDGFETIWRGALDPVQTVSLTVTAIGREQFADLSDELGSSGGQRGLVLVGSADDESIVSGAGDDDLNGANGNDRFEGGAGIDLLRGAGGDDILDGGAGDDTLDGGAGNDLLEASIGNDALAGGLGIDTVDYGAAPGGVTVDLSLGAAQAVGADQGSDRLSGVENLTGSARGDVLMGDGNGNLLNGGSGNDTLDGRGGGDSMAGGGGSDVYGVDDLGDIVIELIDQGYDSINTTLSSMALGANVERVNSTSGLNFVGTGNALDNRFQSLGGNDRFVDVLGGADIFSGGGGTDTVDFRSSGAGVVLDFITDVHGGAAAGDIYAGIEKFLGSNTAADTMTMGGTGRALFVGGGGDDALAGGIKNDQLIGQGGNDTLIGNADRDSLDGGIGNDTMTGGAAGDVFVYADAAFGQDTISDFEDGLDSFKVSAVVADDIADFNIAGNGTNTVVLTLAAAPASTLTLNGAAPISITAADFAFV